MTRYMRCPRPPTELEIRVWNHVREGWPEGGWGHVEPVDMMAETVMFLSLCESVCDVRDDLIISNEFYAPGIELTFMVKTYATATDMRNFRVEPRPIWSRSDPISHQKTKTAPAQPNRHEPGWLWLKEPASRDLFQRHRPRL